MDQATRDRINESFAAQSMMRTLGADLAHVGMASVHIRAPILPGCLQQQGFGHAGLTFSIGDSAAGYAALTTLSLEQEVLTAEIKINLLAPAQGDYLIAKGRVIKPGRRLVVVASDIYAVAGDDQTLIAVTQGTMIPVKR